MAPQHIKMQTVRSYLSAFGLSTFVETGTYLGDTLGYVARSGAECISLELSESLSAAAAARFKNHHNVRLIQGDSAQTLPLVLQDLKVPALFWLDGHFSAGITSRGEIQTPIRAELQVILNHAVQGHVILIDDARCFDGTHDYPRLEEVLALLYDTGRYRVEVSADIIRATPL